MKKFVIISLLLILTLSVFADNFSIYGIWKEHGRTTSTIVFYEDGSFGVKLSRNKEAKGSFTMDGNIITATFSIKNVYYKCTYDIIRKYRDKFIARVVTINEATGNVVQNEIVTVKRVARSSRILG